jgi:hypothetical protein
MLQKYKEIVYGLLFGVGAAAIDTVMHAQMTDRSFWDELLEPQPAMIFYRVLFLLFGLALGWLLWQKNKRERDFRQLTEALERFHRELCAPALLMHTRLQVLLTREDFHLSHEAEEAVRFAYERSQEIQALAKEKPQAQGGS